MGWSSEEGDWGELDWFLGSSAKGCLEAKVFASHDTEADYPDEGTPPIAEWIWCVRTLGESFDRCDQDDECILLISGRATTAEEAKQAAQDFLKQLASSITASLAG